MKHFLFLFLLTATAAAQTTVTGTITDTDSLVWAGATITATAQGAIPPDTPSQVGVVADSSGNYSITLPFISSNGGTWQFQITAITSPGSLIPSVYTSAPIAVANGGSPTQNFAPPGPRFPDPGFAYGYGTVEVQPPPTTYGVNFQVQPGVTCDWYTASGWANCPSGGGSTNTICSGTIALGTDAISSGAAASTVTKTCTGLETTDAIQLSFDGSPLAVTGYVPSADGMLTVLSWPTSNTINVSVVNNTSGSITPGAITLNYRVTR